MKNNKKYFLLIVLTISLIYITNITSIPENIIIFQNEKYEIDYLKGFNIYGAEEENEKSLIEKFCTINSKIIGETELKLTALGILPIKDISVSVVPQKMVIPSGKAIGVKIYSKGVLVIGTSNVDGIDGEKYMPYENTNIEAGDIILKINDQGIETVEELVKMVRDSKGNDIKVTYKHGEEIYEENITPVKSIDDNNYKLGIWVRDGAMGIGTTTFFDPETNKFAALGHGISDIDTKGKIEMDYGTVNGVDILSVTQSKKSNPGELVGVLDSFEVYGEISKNNEYGVFGKISNDGRESFITSNLMPVASRNEVETGEATILCTLDDDIIKEYKVEIQKKQLQFGNETRSMVIKIIDEDLINQTGGIVQGMSGSPIIQNGKLVGALTHVFVNDPTKGYAIFADTMLEQ